MAEIILVRHGQANSSASDEASYDRLSELGHRQAAWLGAHLRDAHFDHVVRGDMRRHAETAAGIGRAAQVDPRWNELSYFALSDALEAKTGIPHPPAGPGFIHHATQVFAHWQDDALTGVPERYGAFENRVLEALAGLTDQGGRSLVVTSTGVISVILKHVLGLSLEGHMKMLAQTMNTSVHRVSALHGALYLSEFNAVPHLDAPERHHARTFY